MKHAIRCWLLVLITALPLSAVDMDSLLLKSVGGPEIYQQVKDIHTVYMSGTVTLNGLDGRFESYFMSPYYYRASLDFGGFSLVQAYDGESAWQLDHNGFVSELSGYEMRELLKQVYFESYSFLFGGRIPGRVEHRGMIERNDSTYHEVAFYPLDVDTIVAYFDEREGLRRSMTSRLDNLQTETTIGDYRAVDGILFPFHARAEAIGAPMVAEYTTDSVILDRPMDTTLFRLATGNHADYRFPEGADSVVIPFAYRRGHIYVAATVNGVRKAWFILDSGASANIFHQPAVADLNLPVVGTTPAKGIGGYREVNLVRTDSVAIGDLKLIGQICGEMDVSAIAVTTPYDDDFGGVLGHAFLSRFPILVNYRDSSLTVYNPENFSVRPGGAEVPFTVTMNVPTVVAEIDGVQGNFIVDLGNSFGLIIHQDFARINRLEDMLTNVRVINGQFGGVGGAVAGKTADAELFRIGAVNVRGIRVFLPDGGAGITGSAELAGNVGNLVLENFAVLFDYGDNRLIFYETNE